MTSSPGAGKTTLLEKTLESMKDDYKFAVIEGDLYTSRDAERINKFNIPVTQINTEGGCHLDAKMIHQSIQNMDLNSLDLIFIENVGNLVCPASFDLGESYRVLLYSVTEGADKPKKYATMFKTAHVILINKVELAELCNINLKEVEEEIRSINPTCKIMHISALKSETLTEWKDWLKTEISKFQN